MFDGHCRLGASRSRELSSLQYLVRVLETAPEGLPYVNAWNDVRAVGRDRIRLHLEALPDPFVGPHDAALVVLGRNPGWSGSEPARRSAALRANLDDDPAGHVHVYLTEDWAETGGGKWWRKCTRAISESSGLAYVELARSVLAVEFHGYHSQDWAPLPITLPSQWFGFGPVEDAIRRGAVIVVLRGGSDWDVACSGYAVHPSATGRPEDGGHDVQRHLVLRDRSAATRKPAAVASGA